MCPEERLLVTREWSILETPQCQFESLSANKLILHWQLLLKKEKQSYTGELKYLLCPKAFLYFS